MQVRVLSCPLKEVKKDRHNKARQIKELRRQGIIPATSIVSDRKEKLRRKSKLRPNRIRIHQPKIRYSTQIHKKSKAGYCNLCERVAFITRHHLIPKHVRKMSVTPSDMPVTTKLCQPCHTCVHQLFDNYTLKKTYNTVAKLKSHAKIQEHIKWVQKSNPNLPVANR